MTVSPVYQTSPIERTRGTKAEVEARREALLDIIAAGRPMTVRQVFYQATVGVWSRPPRAATPRCRPISRSCAGPATYPTIRGRPVTCAGSVPGWRHHDRRQSTVLAQNRNRFRAWRRARAARAQSDQNVMLDWLYATSDKRQTFGSVELLSEGLSPCGLSRATISLYWLGVVNQERPLFGLFKSPPFHDPKLGELVSLAWTLAWLAHGRSWCQGSFGALRHAN